MIDMGKYKGKVQVWSVGPRPKSLAELIEEGEIVAIPDPEHGIAYKRTAVATDLEKSAAYSVDELRAMRDSLS